MKKGLFSKYLLGFASFFLVPMIALSIILHVVMYQNLRREIINYNGNIVKQLGEELKTMNGQLMETGNQISFSKPVINKVQSQADQMELTNILRQKNAQNSYLSKSYLIWRSQAMSYSSQGVYKKEAMLSGQLRLPESQQQEFLERLYALDKPAYEVINKEFYLKDGTYVKPEMIFIYPVYNYAPGIEGWIILELNTSRIEAELTGSSGLYSQSLGIYNQAGKSLMSAGETLESAVLLNLNQQLTDDRDRFVPVKIDGDEYILAYSKNPALYIANKITVPSLLSNVIHNNNVLVTGVVIFLLLGCLLAIYMAYRYYKPIHQLALYMKQDSEAAEAKNEFEMMKASYDQVNSLKDSLREEIERQWPLVEERLMTKILHDGVPDSSNQDIVSRVFETQMEQKHHLVALLASYKQRPDMAALLTPEREQEIREHLGEYYITHTSFIYYFDAIAVICSANQLDESDKKMIYHQLKAVFAADQLMVVLGSIHDDAAGIHLSYLEALTGMRYQLLHPHQHLNPEVITKPADESAQNLMECYRTDGFLTINRYLDSTDEADAGKAAEEIVLNLKELPGQISMFCCFDIVNHLTREMKRRGISGEENQIRRLTMFGTLEEFGESLKETMEQVKVELASQQQKIRHNMVDEIRRYIDGNFQDSNLNLMGMAEHFGYSSSYMSKFITQNLTQSFSGLVFYKRLEYTKEKLIHTDKPISQIAQEAGYGNLSNFTRRFKSTEKMTPGQYRNIYGTKTDGGN